MNGSMMWQAKPFLATEEASSDLNHGIMTFQSVSRDDPRPRSSRFSSEETSFFNVVQILSY